MDKDYYENSKCDCGYELNFTTTPFMTNEKRICPKCKKIHYVDNAPIDWNKVGKGEMTIDKFR